MLYVLSLGMSHASLLGMIIYDGPSRFDGSPIVAIITGHDRPSKNPKTGTMAQLWILGKTDRPYQAVLDGTDRSVCGNCPLRGDVALEQPRACYVRVMQAPTAVYKRFLSGGYQTATPVEANAILKAKRYSLRLGAYGDPAALPLSVIRELASGIKTTGYTHAWLQSREYQPWIMASVDTASDQAKATRLGWRTFRTRTTNEPLQSGEISCPASAEAGHRTTCADCVLCGGANVQARNISIIAHGSAAIHFVTVRRNAVPMAIVA